MIERKDMKLFKEFVECNDVKTFYDELDDNSKKKLLELAFKFPSECISVMYSTIITKYLDLDFEESLEYVDVEKGIPSIMYMPNEVVVFILNVVQSIMKIDIIRNIEEGNNEND